uniref:NTF2 domain-containing protein n=1 Tax=Rhabditophanes sp. KR3021 TaxID=114890 RepID=A0AC35U0G8_9BILA
MHGLDKKDQDETNNAIGLQVNEKTMVKSVYIFEIRNCYAIDINQAMRALLSQGFDFVPIFLKKKTEDVLSFGVLDWNTALKLKTITSFVIEDSGSVLTLNYNPAILEHKILYGEERKCINDICSRRLTDDGTTLDLSNFQLEEKFGNHKYRVTLDRADVLWCIADYIERNCPLIEHISLSSNGLNDITYCNVLTFAAKEVKSLDLSYNYLKNPAVFNALTFWNLETLYVHNCFNRFVCQESPQFCMQIIKNLYPNAEEKQSAVYTTHYGFGVTFAKFNVLNSYFKFIQIEEHIKLFMTEYLKFYDGYAPINSRSRLIKMYDEKAKFSLTYNFIDDGRYCQKKFGLTKSNSPLLQKLSRNIERFKKWQHIRDKINPQNNEDLIEFLRKLPATKHDMDSFVYDVCFQEKRIIMFSVQGFLNDGFTLSKERSFWKDEDIKLFKRTFLMRINDNEYVLHTDHF